MKGAMSIFLTLMNEVHGTILTSSSPYEENISVQKRYLTNWLFLLNFGLSFYKKTRKSDKNLIKLDKWMQDEVTSELRFSTDLNHG